MGAAGFRFKNETFFLFERTRPAASMRPPYLIYLSTSTGVRTRCYYLIIVFCMCVSACATFVFFADCESCTRQISTNPVSMEAGEHGLTRGTWFHRGLSRGGRGRRAAVDFVVCFGWGEFFLDFFLS